MKWGTLAAAVALSGHPRSVLASHNGHSHSHTSALTYFGPPHTGVVVVGATLASSCDGNATVESCASACLAFQPHSQPPLHRRDSPVSEVRSGCIAFSYSAEGSKCCNLSGWSPTYAEQNASKTSAYYYRTVRLVTATLAWSAAEGHVLFHTPLYCLSGVDRENMFHASSCDLDLFFHTACECPFTFVVADLYAIGATRQNTGHAKRELHIGCAHHWRYSYARLGIPSSLRCQCSVFTRFRR